jgi:hypothetical protein
MDMDALDVLGQYWDMQHGHEHAAWADMQHGHEVGHAAWTDMQLGGACSMEDMKHGQTCSRDMNLDVQHVFAYVRVAWK